MRLASMLSVLLLVACGEVTSTEIDAANVDAPGGDPDAPGGDPDAPVSPDAGPPVCGDDITTANEDCDDGNPTDDGNGCSATCLRNSVCGNQRVEWYFEACDGSPGCTANCASATLALTPVSDRGGGDFDGNGTYDALNNETSTGEAIAWTGPSGMEERRIAWEFDSVFLSPKLVVQSAQLSLFPNNISGGPQTLELHAYRANGAVELADMTVSGLIASPIVSSGTAPLAFDARTFLQDQAAIRPPFVGFMLRLRTRPASFFNLGITMSNNTNPAIRPRLDVLVCVDPEGNGC